MFYEPGDYLENLMETDSLLCPNCRAELTVEELTGYDIPMEHLKCRACGYFDIVMSIEDAKEVAKTRHELRRELREARALLAALVETDGIMTNDEFSMAVSEIIEQARRWLAGEEAD